MTVVPIARLAVASRPDEELRAVGLGSCVACVVIADGPSGPVCGMAHVLLPAARDRTADPSPAKFADTAVPALVEEVRRAGGRRPGMRAALVGGARMFGFGSSAARDIGQRNASALAEALRAARIPVVATDVGGSEGRAVRVLVGAGRVLVRSSRNEERELVAAGLQRP